MTTLQTTKGPLTIRATTAADAQALRALRVEALTRSPTSFGSAPEDVDAHDWDAIASGDTENKVFVAEHGNELVAMAGIHRPTRVKERHHADLWGVYVRPAWRKLGLAATLVNACTDWAASQGVAIVKLTVVPESGAMACYLRCGFRVTGVDPAALMWEGKYYDEVLMSRWVEPPSLSH